jgi:hypothetical protein
LQERAVGEEDEDEDIQILSEITAKQSPVKGKDAVELETMNAEESTEDAPGGIDDDAGENCVDDDAYGKAAELEEEEPMNESLICEHCAYVANDIQDARDHASVK